MTDDQIKHMANRFLGWKLPADFWPDGGVSFQNVFGQSWPIGTNLFTAAQAEEMVRYMLDGCEQRQTVPPASPEPVQDRQLVERLMPVLRAIAATGTLERLDLAEIRTALSAAEPAIRGDEQIVAALKPFADCVEHIRDDEPDDEWAKFRLLIGDYRRARAALAAIRSGVE